MSQPGHHLLLARGVSQVMQGFFPSCGILQRRMEGNHCFVAGLIFFAKFLFRDQGSFFDEFSDDSEGEEAGEPVLEVADADFSCSQAGMCLFCGGEGRGIGSGGQGDHRFAFKA